MKSFSDFLLSEASKKQKEEDSLFEKLRYSNLHLCAKNLADQIMVPVFKYYEIPDAAEASTFLSRSTGIFKLSEDFSDKKCMGDYEFEVTYIISNNKTYIDATSETYMKLKILSRTCKAFNDNPSYYNSKDFLNHLGEQIENILEHEMGHYYLEKAHNMGDLLYRGSGGLEKYFEDPQEIALHSKMIFNTIRKRSDIKTMPIERIKAQVEHNVAWLPQNTAAPSIAKFTKTIQKKYVDYIMKNLVEPFLANRDF